MRFDPAICTRIALVIWALAWLLYRLGMVPKFRVLGRAATGFAAAGVLACTLGLVLRWIKGGPAYAPWNSTAESVAWAAAGVVLAQVLLDLRERARFSGSVAAALGVAGLLVARWLGVALDVPVGMGTWRARIGLDLAEVVVMGRAFLVFAAWICFAGAALRGLQHIVRVEARTERVLFGISFAAALLLSLTAGEGFISGAELAIAGVRVPGGGRLLELAIGAFGTQWAGTVALPYLRGPWAGPLARGLRWCFGVGVAALAGLLGMLVYARTTPVGLRLNTEPWLVGAAVAIFGTGAFLATWMVEREKVNEMIPSAAALDLAAYRALATGFACFLLSIALGVAWTALSAGSLWAGGAREAAGLATGACYAAILHVRMQGVGTPRGMAWASLVAFAVAAGAVCAGRLLVTGGGV